jgi:diaminopimelate dehydrogenase
MEKIHFAICGWGNIGKACAAVNSSLQAMRGNAHDFKLAGIIRRSSNSGTLDAPKNVPVVHDFRELKAAVKVIIYIGVTYEAENIIPQYLKRGLITVDSFDTHEKIWAVRNKFDKLCKKHNTVAIHGAGWDPGFDSVQRAMLESISPLDPFYTTFGGAEGGRSMGHTAELKKIAGVENAVSLTFAGAKPGTHIRRTYIYAPDEKQHKRIYAEIQANDPYFIKNEKQYTEVFFVDSKGVKKHDTNKHGGISSSRGKDVRVSVDLYGTNAIMTANMLLASARAATRQRAAGCYTMAEIPPVDYVYGKSLKERLARIRY